MWSSASSQAMAEARAQAIGASDHHLNVLVIELTVGIE
jgi:hypothetical protein